MTESSNAGGDLHELATEHVPAFVPLKGETDTLFVVMIVFVLIVVLIIGNLYFKLHALPERLAHKANLVQFQFIAVLSLLALFTHNNVFWVAALLLALVKIPDFSTPLNSIAESLERMASAPAAEPKPEAPASDAKQES